LALIRSFLIDSASREHFRAHVCANFFAAQHLRNTMRIRKIFTRDERFQSLTFGRVVANDDARSPYFIVITFTRAFLFCIACDARARNSNANDAHIIIDHECLARARTPFVKWSRCFFRWLVVIGSAVRVDSRPHLCDTRHVHHG
jgi:hypothetical protein